MIPDTTRIDIGALATIEASPPVFALFRQALDKGAEGAGAMETLYKLYTAERDHAARLAFHEAFARFQDECPAVPKNGLVDYVSKMGVRVKYASASFEDIATTVHQTLIANGFSYTFDGTSAGGMHTEKVTLQHREGHSITSSFTLPTANNNPGMSDQQKAAGASTFARRYCLIAVLGLTLTDPDPDNESDPTTITEAQAADLLALVQETGADLSRFLKFAGVDSLQAVRVADYPRVVKALEAKRATK